MATRRDVDGAREAGKKEPITRILSSESDLFIDTETGTSFKFVSPERIGELLETEPGRCKVIKQLGLRSTLEISYEKPDWETVKDIVKHFDPEEGRIEYRGMFLPFNMEIIRRAFKLPRGDPTWKKHRWNGAEMSQYFTRKKNVGGKFCLDWLSEDFKHWEGPLRVVSELLLGRRRPSSCTGKLMWYFHNLLVERGTRKPDWSKLIFDDLGGEMMLVKKHLLRGKRDGATNVPCFLGTAVTQILKYYKHLTPSLLAAPCVCLNKSAIDDPSTSPVHKRSKKQASAEANNCLHEENSTRCEGGHNISDDDNIPDDEEANIVHFEFRNEEEQPRDETPRQEGSVGSQIEMIQSLLNTLSASLVVENAGLLKTNTKLQLEIETQAQVKDNMYMQLKDELNLMQTARNNSETLADARNSELLALRNEQGVEMLNVAGQLATLELRVREHEKTIVDLRLELSTITSELLAVRTEQNVDREKVATQLKGYETQVADLERTIQLLRLQLETVTTERNITVSSLQAMIDNQALHTGDLESQNSQHVKVGEELGVLMKSMVAERDVRIAQLQDELSGAQREKLSLELQVKTSKEELEKLEVRRLEEEKELEVKLNTQMNTMELGKQQVTEELAKRDGEIQRLQTGIRVEIDANSAKQGELLGNIETLQTSLLEQTEMHDETKRELLAAQAELQTAKDLEKRQREQLRQADNYANLVKAAAEVKLNALQEKMEVVKRNAKIVGNGHRDLERQMMERAGQIEMLQKELKKSQEQEKETNAKFENSQHLLGTMLDDRATADTIADLKKSGDIDPSGNHEKNANENSNRRNSSGITAQGGSSSHAIACNTVERPRPRKPTQFDEPDIVLSSDEDWDPPSYKRFVAASKAGDVPQPKMDGSDIVAGAEPPRGHLVVTAKDHQKKGLAWMIKRESIQTSSPRGGILADDQGMGKTLQVIMLILTERPIGSTTLVVCPVSVMSQWEKEVETRCSPLAKMKCLRFHGPTRNSPPPDFGEYDVVVTSYATLEFEWRAQQGIGQKKKKQLDSSIYSTKWYRVILDEAQYIKNHKSNTANAVCQLNSTARWCVTGTPLQNSVSDLYSFFRFLQYDSFQTYSQFKHLKARCTKNYKDGMRALRDHLCHFTLRRTKELLGLPAKTSIVKLLDFSDESHRAIYDYYMDKGNEKWMECQNEGGKQSGQTLVYLMRSRQACVHPALTEKKTESGSAKGKKHTKSELKELQSVVNSLEIDSKCQVCQGELLDDVYVSETCKHVYCAECGQEALEDSEGIPCQVSGCRKKAQLVSIYDITGDGDVGPQIIVNKKTSSAKIEAISTYVRNLPPKAPGAIHTEKAIVFSQWTSALNLLQQRLTNDGVKFERVDGKMTPTQRQAALDHFAEDGQVQVLLVSLKAGNCGLNIVAANHVLLLDLWWNPTVEDQAVDRVHRIGQTRPVTVVRFVIQDSIEERVLKLQDKKREMYVSVFSPEDKEPVKNPKSAKETSRRDIDYLLGRTGYY